MLGVFRRFSDKTKIILFVPLLLGGCVDQSNPRETEQELARLSLSSILSSPTKQCLAFGETLNLTRTAYNLQCSGQPRDCDPLDDQWVCSSHILGSYAPNVENLGSSPVACSATGSSLGEAMAAYAQFCTVPRVDCDPLAGAWVCSSNVIGTTAPPTPAPVNDTNKPSPFVEGFTVTAQWNELALAAIRSGSAKPTVTTWQLFMLSAAMYDAYAAYSSVAVPYASGMDRRPATEQTIANQRAAVSQAAYHALLSLFPEFEDSNGYFLSYLQSLGYVPTQANDLSPGSVGYIAATAVFNARENDGSNSQNGFKPTTSLIYPEIYHPVNSPDPMDSNSVGGLNFNPNAWQPLRVPNGTVLNEAELAIVDNLNINSFGDQEFLTSHWGAVTPFALAYGAEFRPSPPPMFGSHEAYTDARGNRTTNDAAYRSQINEVLDYSANLNDRLKIIAEFWADGPRTESPPGHWNQLAHGVIERDELNLAESIRLFFALNAALLDASIATWEAKRFYDYTRPASAIRWLYQDTQIQAWGGPNRGTEAILGRNWSPYQSITFVTPPFPEYVSGHSTFSRAAAEVLKRITGTDNFYDGHTRTLQDVNGDGELDMLGEHIARAGSFFIEDGPKQDVILQWKTFTEAADEAGLSRLYGGIHIQDGDLRGRELGRKIGERAYNKAVQLFEGK